MLPNLLFSITMIVLSIYMFVYSTILGGTAAIFPKLTSIPFFIFSVISLVLVFKDRKNNINVEKKDFTNIRKSINFVLLMIAYTLIIEWVGYYISTLVLFILTALILTDDKKKWQSNKAKFHLLLVAFITVALVYFIFKVLLGVPLPELMME